MTVEIYTDGSCLHNPGPGGWGAILVYGDVEKEISGGEDETTNNRMELMAAIMALEALKRPVDVTLTSDSTYLKDGITKWIKGWKKNGWKTAAKKPVANQDLWQRLQTQRERHQLIAEWTRGHAGNTHNERCDQLAVEAIEQLRTRGETC